CVPSARDTASFVRACPAFPTSTGFRSTPRSRLKRGALAIRCPSICHPRFEPRRTIMKSFKITAAQGEVNIRRVDAMPDGLNPVAPERGVYIIGHSESGNTHVIDAPGVTVMERTKAVPAGMRMLYAIVEKAT